MDDFNNDLRVSAKNVLPLALAREQWAQHIVIGLESERLQQVCEQLKHLLSPYCSGRCPNKIKYKKAS